MSTNLPLKVLTSFLLICLFAISCENKEVEKNRKGKVMNVINEINGTKIDTGRSALVMKDKEDRMFYCLVNKDIGDAFELTIEEKGKSNEFYSCPNENVREINP